MKVDEVHNCEGDYHCQQAKTEDVTNIVAGHARTRPFCILPVGVGTDQPLYIPVLFGQA